MALSMAAGAINTSEEQARRQWAVADARGLTRPSRGGCGPLRENRGFGQVGVKKLALWRHEALAYARTRDPPDRSVGRKPGHAHSTAKLLASATGSASSRNLRDGFRGKSPNSVEPPGRG
jgi:hypothetical protein